MKCLHRAVIVVLSGFLVVPLVTLAEMSTSTTSGAATMPDMTQMTSRNVANQVQTVSMLASDLSKMCKGDVSTQLQDVSSQLSNWYSQHSSGQLGTTSGTTATGSSDLSSIRSKTQQLSQQIMSDKTKAQITSGSELDRANKMFMGHGSMLAGQLAAQAGYLNAMAATGQGGSNITQGQATQFMHQASRLMNTFSGGSSGGMYGSMDTSAGSSSMYDSNMSSSSGTYSADANNQGKHKGWFKHDANKPGKHKGWGKQSESGGMIGASMQTGDLSSASSLMRSMASSLGGQSTQDQQHLAGIVDDLSQIKTQISSGSSASSSGNIGSMDSNATSGVEYKKSAYTSSDTNMSTGQSSGMGTDANMSTGSSSGMGTDANASTGSSSGMSGGMDSNTSSGGSRY